MNVLTLSDFYTYSWFSNLAYVLWNNDNTASKQKMIDVAGDPSVARVPTELGAEIFINQGWTVTNFQENDLAGFAANVFEKEGTNEKVLAIRGTEGGGLLAGGEQTVEALKDLLFEDFLDIGGLGLALRQAVGMFNYIQRLQGVEGSDVTQLKLNFSTDVTLVPDLPRSVVRDEAGVITFYWFEEIDGTGLGEGVLKAGDQVTVTGDSLGGHLSALALRLFPSLFDQAVTFSSPGFDPVFSLDGFGEQLTDEFVDLFSNFIDPLNPPAATFTELSPRLYTLESEDSAPGDDNDVVSGILTGNPASAETFIRVENTSHAMDQFMDALAVHALVANLNPQLTNDEIFALYDAISNSPDDTEEKYVQALSKLFLSTDDDPSNNVPLKTAKADLISTGTFLNRTAIHERILQIQAETKDKGYILESLIDRSTVELVSMAQNDVAYRYALQELNPFAVIGTVPLYDQQQQELDVENFSDEYLTDRADFLTLKVELGLTDRTSKTGGENITYSDSLSNVSLNINKSAGAGQLPHERITFTSSKAGETTFTQGGGKADRLYGFQGNDILVGGTGQKTVDGETIGDFLEGGAGNDILYSNNFARDEDDVKDILRGGKGEDAYYVGDGDEIEDSDRKVQIIEFNAVTIGGQYVEILPDQYESLNNNNLTLKIAGNDAVISLAQGSITKTFTIKNVKDAGVNFTDGDYGITLLNQTPSAPIEFNGTVNKDIIGVDDTGTQVDLLDRSRGQALHMTFN